MTRQSEYYPEWCLQKVTLVTGSSIEVGGECELLKRADSELDPSDKSRCLTITLGVIYEFEFIPTDFDDIVRLQLTAVYRFIINHCRHRDANTRTAVEPLRNIYLGSNPIFVDPKTRDLSPSNW